VLRRSVIATVVVCVLALGFVAIGELTHRDPLPSFEQQICSLEPSWLTAIRRGYFEPRAGQISLLPRTPAYMAGGGQGWSHSGPWDYLQNVPLVVYGPGRIPSRGEVTGPATTADIAPTMGALLKGSLRSDGKVLTEAAPISGRTIRRPSPKLILTVVLDGAGWNVLELWPESWPVLRDMMDQGVSYVDARVGSSPSVTPAIHTTLGTGYFPATHGISSVEVRDEEGEVVDSFFEGESSRYIQTPTVAERWDEQNDNRALVAMVGHVPWHLGMIGQGAEKPGGDLDHAAWLDPETNNWETNEEHYSLPPEFGDQSHLLREMEEFERADGAHDQEWKGVPVLDRSRWEELPPFAQHQTEELIGLMESEGYGEDEVTDLVFTNFKQIDLLGHYFNMASTQVRDALVAGDAALGMLIEHLERTVGHGAYVVIVTADHGQQPDAGAVDAYGIDPNEVYRDLRARFGDAVLDVAPTEVFVDEDALAEAGLTIEDVATFLGEYQLSDNARWITQELVGAGMFAAADRVFQMAVPARLLNEVQC
jgi:predicted AlkP superfamily pyrophosphatase or phosphodiesterase